MVARGDYAGTLHSLLRRWPAVTLLGPRQCGKTTFVQEALPGWTYLDLERPSDAGPLTADPEARLLYNDYGAEGAGAKSDGVYNLMAELRQKGVPVHGVGLQMHVSLDEVPNVDDVRINMKRLAALNLETHITEMDVMLHMPMTQHDLEAQAKVYRDMLRTCLTVLACRSFSTWGVADRYSWIPEFFPGYGAALLFDADLRPKPAAAAVRRLLR